MVDLQTVCCMCGDVGFADKLFRCNKCRHRFQHLYCSNYYSEHAEPTQVCDWCQSEERNSFRQVSGSSKKSSFSSLSISHDHAAGGGSSTRSEFLPDHKIKQHETSTASSDKGNNSNISRNPSGAPSPRTATRRYKLLKDVMMC